MRRNIILEAELKPYGPAHPNQPQEINGIVYFFFFIKPCIQGFFLMSHVEKTDKMFWLEDGTKMQFL